MKLLVFSIFLACILFKVFRVESCWKFSLYNYIEGKKNFRGAKMNAIWNCDDEDFQIRDNDQKLYCTLCKLLMELTIMR